MIAIPETVWNKLSIFGAKINTTDLLDPIADFENELIMNNRVKKYPSLVGKFRFCSLITHLYSNSNKKISPRYTEGHSYTFVGKLFTISLPHFTEFFSLSYYFSFPMLYTS